MILALVILVESLDSLLVAKRDKVLCSIEVIPEHPCDLLNASPPPAPKLPVPRN